MFEKIIRFETAISSRKRYLNGVIKLTAPLSNMAAPLAESELVGLITI